MTKRRLSSRVWLVSTLSHCPGSPGHMQQGPSTRGRGIWSRVDGCASARGWLCRSTTAGATQDGQTAPPSAGAHTTSPSRDEAGEAGEGHLPTRIREMQSLWRAEWSTPQNKAQGGPPPTWPRCTSPALVRPMSSKCAALPDLDASWLEYTDKSIHESRKK